MELYDLLLANKINGGGGGGSSVTVEPLSVTSNGTYSETGKAYSPVSVNVPTPSGSANISANGTYDVTQYASAYIAVPNSYTASDEGKVVSSGALVAQTSQSIDTNGTYDTTLKNSVTVNVSGGGGASNIVTGFISPTTAGEITIDTGYTGTGYPIMLVVENVNGWKNLSGMGNNNIADAAVFKIDATKTPSDDKYYLGARKWSDYGTNKMATFNNIPIINQSSINSTVGFCMPNNTTLKINFVNSGASGAGFPVGEQYRYTVAYSS